MSAKSKKRFQIFLIHGSEDKPVVKRLYRQLQKAGFQPWLDSENLLPGERWWEAIQMAVRESDAIIACLSRSSIAKSGVVQKEIKFALDLADEAPDGAIVLIPVMLEECEIPARLGHLHCVTLASNDGFDKLRRTLEREAGKVKWELTPTVHQKELPIETGIPPKLGFRVSISFALFLLTLALPQFHVSFSAPNDQFKLLLFISGGGVLFLFFALVFSALAFAIKIKYLKEKK